MFEHFSIVNHRIFDLSVNYRVKTESSGSFCEGQPGQAWILKISESDLLETS